MKKTIFLFSILLLGIEQGSFAANYVVPVYFHSIGGVSVNTLFQMVCDLNNNYRNANLPNPVPITFYLGKYDNLAWSASMPNNTGQGIFPDLLPWGMNVYLGQSENKYRPNNSINDGITLVGPSSEVLTHEAGHWLGLLHREAAQTSVVGCGNSSCSTAGDPDCCADTPPPTVIVDNIMNSGGGTLLTNCQRGKIITCASSKGFTTSSVNYATLNVSHSYVMPLEKYTQTGVVSFEFAYCNTLPSSVTLKVRTGCKSNSPQAYMYYTINDLSTPFQINIVPGVQTIEFTYHYQGTSAVNKRLVDNPDIIKSPNYSCPPGPLFKMAGGSADDDIDLGKRIMTGDAESNITIIAKDNIIYTNYGFKAAYVYDLSGRILSKADLADGFGEMNTSDLPAGLYIFKAIKANGEFKIIRFNK
jgi:hypothetical protein